MYEPNRLKIKSVTLKKKKNGFYLKYNSPSPGRKILKSSGSVRKSTYLANYSAVTKAVSNNSSNRSNSYKKAAETPNSNTAMKI